MSDGTRVITLACRTSDRVLDGTRGAVALAPMFAEHLGIATHTIGSASAPQVASWADDLEASRGCLMEAGGQVEDSMNGGLAPVLLHSECSLALSTLPTIARMRPDARILWLDAHGDYNTPDTTQSGYLGGMPLAGACGEWDADLDVGFVDPARVVHAGARDIVGFEVTNFQAPIEEFERLLGATAVKRVVEPLLDSLKEGAHVRH
jgi:arginase